MNRRGFLAGFAALVGGIALEEAIPFGRVWSFPKEIKLCPLTDAEMDEFSLKYILPAFRVIAAQISKRMDEDADLFFRPYDPDFITWYDAKLPPLTSPQFLE